MTATRMTRGIPVVRKVLGLGGQTGRRPVCIVVRPRVNQERSFYRGSFGRDNPFTQMEEFMKDMEKKFRRDMDTMFRDMPTRILDPMRGAVAEARPRPRFGEMEDVSTADTYKLAFNFPNAKPEDVTVSLKGHTLKVSGSAEEVTETSKSTRQITVEYTIPEGVNVDALESCMSHEGILTIEAPQTPPDAPEAPRPIDIKRE